MCVGAFVFSFPSHLPDPTQNGYRCTGTEAGLRECPRGDPDTNSAGVLCLSRLRIVCKNGSSSITSDAPTPISTTKSMDQTTGSTTTELDMPQSSSEQAILQTGSTSDEELSSTISSATQSSSQQTILQTGSTSDEELSSTISSAASDTSQQNFLSGSRLYNFIAVVGAVLVAIMVLVLVQILLTHLCFKYCPKEVSSKSQKSKGQDDQLDGSSKTPTTSANTRLNNPVSDHTIEKKDSSDSQKAAPPIPSWDRTPSKSSITSPRNINSSSLPSSSNSIQQSEKSVVESRDSFKDHR